MLKPGLRFIPSPLIPCCVPVWGDFYAKGGNGVYAYNTGFGTDPDLLTTDFNPWLMVPGTKTAGAFARQRPAPGLRARGFSSGEISPPAKKDLRDTEAGRAPAAFAHPAAPPGGAVLFLGERRLLMWPDSIKLFDNSPFIPGGVKQKRTQAMALFRIGAQMGRSGLLSKIAP